jgi:uncharacterized protein (DUF4415 family)
MKTDPDMRAEYDFSKGKRGAVIPRADKIQTENSKGKIRITTYLDSDVLVLLKARGEAESKGYQTVLNELLRKQLEHQQPIADILRQVIREELKLAA